ncbi:MarR family winged helix-turn-helix transcriptional regulator [Noviherbaspirillum pedocola]|uniref:MarR family transcriptional regulator n=1 Tax=Noviherbaspirillum pedocola TaxID=2801341 RepID=A0A934SQ96_9BURK|nr:MarR family transcriptional regulator [Noviherbaspirillum pedocola]MBK4733131.1 MarR family transcriptional regulator [Noviherbaspirillum pedocola]
MQELFSDGNYAVERSVGYLLARSRARLARALDVELAAHGITHAQGSIILMLASGRFSTAAELARELYVDSASMTRIVDRLQKRGMLLRMPRVGDRRIIDLRLTEEGQRLGRLLPDLYAQVLNRSFQKFSPEEIRQLRSLLCKLLDEEDIVAGAAACARLQEQHHD